MEKSENIQISKEARIIQDKSDMSQEDLIETILAIIYKILDYTNELDQRTPSIFDQKFSKHLEQEKEIESDKLSTSSSSNEENKFPERKDENCNFTLHDFLYFWTEKLEFNKNLLLLTMMNLDKLLSNEFILTYDNVKNTLYICMVITQKMYEDETYKDKDYAKLLDVTTEELIQMEKEFLKIVDFSLFINEEEFNKYYKKMYKIWKKTFSAVNFS